jgi:hypothetical protein
MLLAALLVAGQLAGSSVRACESSTQHLGCCNDVRLAAFDGNISTPDCCRIQQDRAAPVVGRSIVSSGDVGGSFATAGVSVAHVWLAEPRLILGRGYIHRSRPIFIRDCNLRI